MSLSKARNRERMREFRLHKRLDTQLAMRLRERNSKPVRVCEACGYSQTVDTHHEGELREKHTLCPNCHGLVTRRIKTLEQLLPLTESKPVQPKLSTDAGPYWGLSNLPLDNKPPRETVELDADGYLIPEL